MEKHDIEEEALKLAREDRAALAQRLLLSLEDIGEGDFSEEWLAEAHRRARQLDAGEVQPVPAEEVMRKARALLR